MTELQYQASPNVLFATNTFINVPVILQFEDTPLIEVVKEQSLGYTTQIPIYHQDGTYLAKTNGTRIYPTDDGKKAGLNIRELSNMWVCEMDGKTLFEIQHNSGDSFKVSAELHTPEGYFVRYQDTPAPSKLLNNSGEPLQVGGLVMSENTFHRCDIGIWIKKDGSIAAGYNK